LYTPHRVPEALKEPLKKELDTWVEQEILAKVSEPTDWVNSLVCVAKSTGKLCLCLDPKDLNCAIKRPHYFTPTLEDILPKLNGAKCFSILDARSGYWNIKLTKESSLLTTFNSPFGRYRKLRLPFGLVCAQDIFQRKVDETFGDLPCVQELQMTLWCLATKVILAIMMKTFMLFFSVLTKLVFASTWTNVDSGALKFPSLAIS